MEISFFEDMEYKVKIENDFFIDIPQEQFKIETFPNFVKQENNEGVSMDDCFNAEFDPNDAQVDLKDASFSDSSESEISCNQISIKSQSKARKRKSYIPHRCTESNCNSIIKTKEAFITHLKHSHGGIHLCKYCPRQFPSWPNLSSHLKSSHKAELKADMTCSHCPKSFSCKRKLDKHNNAYHGISLPKDDLKAAQNKPKKKKKLGLGLEEKPLLKCSECKEKFKNHQNLSNHKRLAHSGEKSCKFCQKMFPSMAKMMGHLSMKHSEEITKSSSIRQLERNSTQVSVKEESFPLENVPGEEIFGI